MSYIDALIHIDKWVCRLTISLKVDMLHSFMKVLSMDVVWWKSAIMCDVLDHMRSRWRMGKMGDFALGVGWTNGCGGDGERYTKMKNVKSEVNDSSVPDETRWMPVRHKKGNENWNLWHHPNPQECCGPTRPKPTKNATDSKWERQYLLYQANGNKLERE